jgi:CubicO group peptidase (beta-lactamase class C family)
MAPVDASAVAAAIAPYVGTQFPGISVAIGYDGRVIFARGYGKADLASGAAMTARTRLGIGSIGRLDALDLLAHVTKAKRMR